MEMTNMTSGARMRLFWTLIFFEACIISINAYAGLNMAVARGGTIMMALPLMMIWNLPRGLPHASAKGATRSR